MRHGPFVRNSVLLKYIRLDVRLRAWFPQSAGVASPSEPDREGNTGSGREWSQSNAAWKVSFSLLFAQGEPPSVNEFDGMRLKRGRAILCEAFRQCIDRQ